MKRQAAATFLLFLFGLAASSCGSRHTVERPDTTRPAVVSTSPAGNETAVAVTTAITATFSESMDASTINDASFLLVSVASASTAAIAGTVTYAEAGSIAVFTPNSSLEHNTRYTATITTDAKDAAGNALSAALSWSFTTIPSPGALDTTFGSGGRARTGLGFSDDSALAAAIQPDGKIVTAGYSSVVTVVTSTISTITNYFTIARFQSNGALDTTFGSPANGRADYFIGTAGSVALQSDGKIVAGGSNGASPSSFSDFLIARYNADGILDSGFAIAGTTAVDMGFDRDVINSLAIQDDGKIVVAGDGINSGPVTYASLIARFNADGTPDTAFNSGGKIIINTIGATSRARVVKIQSDGKILVGGNFQEAGGAQSIYLTRYDSSGTLDTLFSTGIVTASTGTDCVMADFEVLSDGKILVTGTTNMGADDVFLMRFNADGAMDSAFGVNGLVITDDVNHGVETAAGLAMQADGKIIVAATFRPVSGLILTSNFALFRYTADGVLDTSFGNGHGMVATDFGNGADDFVGDVHIQQDGKITAAGWAWNGSNYDIGLARYWP